MANTVYTPYKNALLSASTAGVAAPDLLTASIKAALVSIAGGATNYTFSAAHQFFSTANVPTASIIAAGVVLPGKTISALAITPAIFSATAVNWTGIASYTSTAQAVILYFDTGTAATSPLLGYLDTMSSGFPLASPITGNVSLTWATSVIALS